MVALLALALLGLGAAWWAWEAAPERGRMAILMAGGAMLNLLLIGAYLHLRERLLHRRDEIRRCRRELRHLRDWSGEEGILRKTGLIRDLNDLGASPGELEQISLPGADLRGVDLRGCLLRGADLRDADLQGALLDGADLWGANLSGADLGRAGLRGASLRGANLRGAMLLKADLDGANLHRADLVNANVEGAGLAGAHLERARFAVGPQADFSNTLHPSVEDWIRERLDARGYYRGDGGDTAAGPRKGPGRLPGGDDSA